MERILNCRTPPKKRGWQKLWRQYGVLATSAQQRKALATEKRNACAGCGCACFGLTPEGKLLVLAPYHAEHEWPLELVDRNDWPHCLWFWSIHNLRWMCAYCHKIKTAYEAKARAKIKRIAAKPKLRRAVARPGLIDGYSARPATERR